MKKLTVLLSTLLIFYCAGAQQILSGIYSGSMYNDSTKILTKYELALSEYRGKVMGYSYNTFIVNDTFYYGIRRVKGYKNDRNELVLTDEELLANNFPESPAKRVKRTATFPLAQEDTITNLTGTWQTNRTKLYYSVGGPAKTERSLDSSQSPLVAHLKELNIISDKPHYQDDPVVKNKKKDEKKPKELKEPETAVAKRTEKPGNQPAEDGAQAATTPAVKDIAANAKPTRDNAPGKNAVAAAARKEGAGGNADSKAVTTAPANKVASTSPAGTAPAQDQKPSLAGATPPTNPTAQGNAAPRKEEPAVAKATDKPVAAGNAAATTTNNNDIDPTTGDLVTRKPASDKAARNASAPAGNKPAEGPQVATVKTTDNQPASKGSATAPVSTTPQVVADSKPAADKAPAAVAAAAALDTRTSAVIKTLDVVNDSVTLSFYDNGVVDGDVISVFVNGVNVVASQKLNEVAIKKTIHLTNFASDSVEITLVAETLGSIPPNTGLVLVRDGDTRYDVRFSADMKTNATIIFRKARK